MTPSKETRSCASGGQLAGLGPPRKELQGGFICASVQLFYALSIPKMKPLGFPL